MTPIAGLAYATGNPRPRLGRGLGRGVPGRAACTLERRPQGPHRRRQVRELLAVVVRERLEPLPSRRGQRQADDARVRPIGVAAHEPGGGGAIDQAHRGVMLNDEVCGDVADRRAARVGVALDREQELVLRGGDPGGPRLALAPSQEAPQARPQPQQELEIGLFQGSHVVVRYRNSICLVP